MRYNYNLQIFFTRQRRVYQLVTYNWFSILDLLKWNFTGVKHENDSIELRLIVSEYLAKYLVLKYRLIDMKLNRTSAQGRSY